MLVRVTPGVDADTHSYIRTGHDDSKFGFSLAGGAAAAAVAEARRAPHLELVGLHAHIGSQLLDLSEQPEAARLLADFAADGRRHRPAPDQHGRRPRHRLHP